MKNKSVWAWILLAASVVLSVVSYILLPETVVTQFSMGNSNVTTMPKPLAILIPFALGVGGAVMTLFGKGDEQRRWKSLIVAIVGIVVFALMLVVNL